MCCSRTYFLALRQVCTSCAHCVIVVVNAFGNFTLLGVPDNQVFELSDYIWSYLIEKSKVNFEKH